MDLLQCQGLAVQNQPGAPQRESVAGTAVKGAAVGAAAGAVDGGCLSGLMVFVTASHRARSSAVGAGVRFAFGAGVRFAFFTTTMCLAVGHVSAPV